MTAPLQGGRVLVVGPSNSGKTHRTADALETWVRERGTDGVVVLDFAPEIEADGRLLGGRLSRFLDVPGGVWYGVLDARAPRTEGDTDDEALALARENADRAARLLDSAPPAPVAVFVNDATIAFQHEVGNTDELLGYCAGAYLVVLNAYEGDALGTDDPISVRERDVLQRFRGWADRIVELPDGPDDGSVDDDG